MKHLILTLLTLSITAPALASHAYRTEDCTGANGLVFAYKGNGPVGGYYDIYNAADKDDEAKHLMTIPNVNPANGDYTADDIAKADILYSSVNKILIGKVKKTHEDGFDSSAWTSRQTLRFDRVSAKATELVGVKAGEKIVVDCAETTDYPY